MTDQTKVRNAEILENGILSWRKKMYVCLQVRQQEIPSESFYTKLSKNRQNCRLCLDTFSSAIMNNFTMTFTSRLKMDANCASQQWNWIRVGTILGHPQLVECMGICVLSLAHVSELRGSDVICILWKNIWTFFFKFSQGTCLWNAFAWIFFGIFLFL